MNTTLDEAAALASEVAAGAPDSNNVEIILCPPFISLAAVRQAVSGSPVMVGAQNMYFESAGAFTGEVSPEMLRSLCQYVILGHSERRQLFGETDETVNRKVHAALAAGLRPIVCVGETLAQREAGQAADVVEGQVLAGVADVHDITDVVLAYEPIWAIGTGRAATPEIAEEIMGGPIHDALRDLFGDDADSVPLLYGGSVSPGNAAAFAAQPSIHGALVGGASLQADQFLQVAAAVADAKW
jgi:triosephosphate isomerase